MGTAMKIALVGIGKIALDQHVPALNASPDWEVVATVSRSGTVPGVEAFTRIEDMLAARPDIGVVSLALPPVPRFAVAEAALRAGRHVMLEKPPAASLAEIHALERLATGQGVSLYTSWHSREAAGVAAVKAWLKDKTVKSGHITWREDVRKWHPGQDWIFEAGGMGVFDPGINALSILTEILPMPVHLSGAKLDFPCNRSAPIAARLRFAQGITADFDFRQEGPQIWDMEFATDKGDIALRTGGNVMEINGKQAGGENTIMGEYPALYAKMARLVEAGLSDIDLRPMVLVADAFTLGQRNRVAAFDF